MRIKAFLSILVFFLSLQLSARPARPGTYTFSQPDGSTFTATCVGDEFLKITKTADGHAIICDNEGWWCYAAYNSDGSRYSSGYRVGEAVPASILSGSRNIPFDILAKKAHSRRLTVNNARPPLMRRLMHAQQAETKSGSEAFTKRGIIILAEFSDVQFNFKKENFRDLLTREGYNYNGATGCVKEYFNAQFEGSVNFEFEVSDIITLDKKRQHYGGNDKNGDDKNPAQMIKEACEAADADIDFSLYDQDGDGEIDNVFVFFAGGDEAEGFDDECIWSHAWWVKDGAGINCTLDGKILNSYACTSELSRQSDGRTTDMTGIGTFCHEYSHTLGLPDLYDTDYDYDGGWAAGVWQSTSLMDGGNMNNFNNTPPYYNAIEREILGLSEPILLEKNGTYTLTPIQDNIVYRLNTDTDGEYYLFECRANEGWDKYIGGKGMLVYHIDKTSGYLDRWNVDNTVNAFQSHQCADLIEADGRTDEITEETYYDAFENISGIFFPYYSVNSLTPTSNPGIKFWSGEESEISITNIQRSNGNITFNVTGFSQTITPPTARSIKTETFMDAVIINFESSWEYEGAATVKWGRVGQEAKEVNVMPYEPGKYSIILEKLIPGNKTYTAKISFTIEDITGSSAEVSFMTSKEPTVDWPYIFIGKNKANDDGTFTRGTKIALRTYNTSEAEAINWTFNDSTISPEGNGYYTVKESGVLRAHIYWADGSQDIIEKKINVSEE